MPLITVRAMENVLSEAQKKEIADRITETFVDVVGEPVRDVTWVIVDEVRSGDWTMAGRPVTTGAVLELLGAPSAR